MTTTVKEKLRAGKIVTVVNINYPAPGLVERLGDLGFDIAFVDCEKSSHSFERIEEMGRAGRASGVATVVRPWVNEEGLVSRLLDLRVDGLMLPTIETAEEVRRLVEGVRYARYQDHEKKIVMATVESPAAVRNLPSLLTVEGVDVWSIGVNDLAHRLGHPGQASEPAVQAVLHEAIRAITGAGKVCATVVTRDNSKALIAAGVRCLITNVNALLATGADDYHRSYRG